MAFKTAAIQAFKKGFMEASPVLLEPIASLTVTVPDDYTGDVYYIRLKLADSKGKTLSTNFYVLSANEGNLQQLASLPEVNLTVSTERYSDNTLTVFLKNACDTPAMMIRLNLKTDDGEQVLPVDYSDNYFHLMPGEECFVNIEWNKADARQKVPFVEMTGYNVKQRTLR